MRIKILMVSDDVMAGMADSRILKDKGLLVHTCYDTENAPGVIDEIKPDLIFINPHVNNPAITNLYNSLVGSMSITGIPIVYTLSEDDVYLVNRKRTSMRDKRHFICDNIVDAIKVAMQRNAPSAKSVYIQKKQHSDSNKDHKQPYIN